MLLLDRYNDPTKTVYYIAASAYDYLVNNPGVDASALYQACIEMLPCKDINHDFFIMALDFLYLLERVTIDKKGGLYVYQGVAD